MASLYSLTLEEDAAFKRALDGAGFDAETIRMISDSEDMAGLMLNALGLHPTFNLVHGMFLKPEAQIARIRALNSARNWGFTESSFERAAMTVPEWPEGSLVVLTLVPYLESKGSVPGYVRTFIECWKVAEVEHQRSDIWNERSIPENLRLLEGIAHTPGLRWEVINLGCGRNEKPYKHRLAESSPHAGIVASAMLHPVWVKSMNGEDVPYAWISGYEHVHSDLPEEKRPGHRCTPILRFNKRFGRIWMGFRRGDGSGSGLAVPLLLKSVSTSV